MATGTLGPRKVPSSTSHGADLALYQTSFYRPDIQGIRAISALLIMIYHIWLNRVSGGVDVFFVISGFLMTTTLLRGASTKSKVSVIAFWKRIVLRVFPSAYLVLLITLVLSAFFVPPPLWKYGLNELIASAAHIENLELIRMGSSYLDREAPPSQFQQFWALSIQMQFYLFLPFLIGMLVVLARRARSWVAIPVGITLFAAISFGYSFIETAANPDAAYFNPGTRVWEFLAGAALASVYPFVSSHSSKVSRIVWETVAVVAVLTLVTFGVWSGESPQFPGWISLVPVCAAIVLILAGRNPDGSTWVSRVLSNRVLVYLGGFSFTIYLWHWPLLVFAQHQFGSTTLTLWQGLVVIGTAIVLAALTKRFVEDPTRIAPTGSKGTRRAIVYVLIAAGVLGVGVAGRQALITKSSDYLAQLKQSQTTAGPTGNTDEIGLPLMRFATVDYDRPRGINCLGGNHCTLGDKNAERSIALIGDSHTAQWVDAADYLGKELGYKIETYLNQRNVEYVIDEIQPEAVITVATKTTSSADTELESVRDNEIQTWKQLSDAGIEILGIRDNPRFGFYQNACLWQNREASAECSLVRNEVFVKDNPSKLAEEQIKNFHSIDLSDFFCLDGSCPAVINSSFIYYDRHHMTRTFVNSVSDEFVNQLLAQAPGVISNEQ